MCGCYIFPFYLFTNVINAYTFKNRSVLHSHTQEIIHTKSQNYLNTSQLNTITSIITTMPKTNMKMQVYTNLHVWIFKITHRMNRRIIKCQTWKTYKKYHKQRRFSLGKSYPKTQVPMWKNGMHFGLNG